MVYVTLRNGKVLQYNSAQRVQVEGSVLRLMTENSNYWVAIIPQDIVERIDGERPCRLGKAPRMRDVRVFRVA